MLKRLRSGRKVGVCIAAAEKDGSYLPNMAERFEAALSEAGARHGAETFPAAHGSMRTDFPVYDHDAAERGLAAMLALFGRTLRP